MPTMTTRTDWRKTCAELIEDVRYLIDCVNHDCFDPVVLMECREHLSQARTALAQPEPEGPPKNCWLDDEPDLCPSPCVFDDPSEVINNCVYALQVKCKTECKYYRAELAKHEPVGPGPTDEELLGIEDLEAAWNAQADAFNSWDELGIDEIVFWAQRQALARWGRPTTEPVPVSEPEGAGVSDEDDMPRLLRRLIGAMIDYMCLPGHVITRDEWEKACLQSGRYCEPFLSGPRSLQPVPVAEPEVPPMPAPGDAEGLAEVFWGRYAQPEPDAERRRTAGAGGRPTTSPLSSSAHAVLDAYQQRALNSREWQDGKGPQLKLAAALYAAAHRLTNDRRQLAAIADELEGVDSRPPDSPYLFDTSTKEQKPPPRLT